MLLVLGFLGVVGIIAISPMLRTEFLGYIGRLVIFILHILNILPDPRFESSQKQGIYSESDLYRWLGIAVPPNASERDISGRRNLPPASASPSTGFSFGSFGLSISGRSPLRPLTLSPSAADAARSGPLDTNPEISLPLSPESLAAPFATPSATPTAVTHSARASAVSSAQVRSSTYSAVSHRRLSSVTTLPTISASGEAEEAEVQYTTEIRTQNNTGALSHKHHHHHANTFSESSLSAMKAHAPLCDEFPPISAVPSAQPQRLTPPKPRESAASSKEHHSSPLEPIVAHQSLPNEALALAETVAAILPSALSSTLQQAIGLSVDTQKFTLLVRSGHMPERAICVDWRSPQEAGAPGDGMGDGQAVLRIGGDTVSLVEITHVVPGKRRSLMAVMPEVKDIPASEAFSVISRGRVWDIYTRNAEQRTEWVTGLKALVKEASCS